MIDLNRIIHPFRNEIKLRELESRCRALAIEHQNEMDKLKLDDYIRTQKNITRINNAHD